MDYSDSNDHDSTMEYSDSDLSETADEATDLQEENDVLKYRLDMATSKIMKLQGTADQITDVEIGREFESLQESIQWWINGVEKDLRKQVRDFRHIFSQVLNSKDQNFVINGLGFGDGTSHEEDAAWVRWLGNLSTCIYVVLGRQIWVYFYKSIFSDTYPIGVSDESEVTFDDILSIMKSGTEDENKIILANKWRSDTITSLTKTENFQGRKRHKAKKFSRGLANTLARWIDPETIERHRSTLEINLIRRAIDLHENIACSSYEYIILAPKSSDLARGDIPDEATLSSWTLKDTVKLIPIYDNIAGVFQCLYPGIYRRGMPGEENVPAAPPVVLVYDHASPKTPRGPFRRSQPQKGLQQGQGKQQVLQRSPLGTPHRSPRPSPERYSQSLPSAAPPNRASTFPLHEDPTTARQAQYRPTSPMLSILNVFSSSNRERKRDKGSSSSRNKPPEPSSHSSLDKKQPKSKSRSRPQSVSISSSPIKSTSTYKTEEVSLPESTELATQEICRTPSAPHSEHEGIMRIRRTPCNDLGPVFDTEIFINKYDAREIRFKCRSNPPGP